MREKNENIDWRMENIPIRELCCTYRSVGTFPVAFAPLLSKSQNASGLEHPPGKRHEIPMTARSAPPPLASEDP